MREHWGSEKGFPGGSVTSIAQTADGYLWIGTEKGLIRFDGLNFRLFQQASPMSFPIGPVQGLMAEAQGSLWILLQSTKILRYHDGKFELGREEAEAGITSVGRRRDGTVLFSSLALGTLTYQSGKFEPLISLAELANSAATATTETSDNLSSRLSWATGVATHRFAEPNSAVISMVESTDGKIWLGTRDKGLFYMREGRVFAAGKGLPNNKINCLLGLENGELWIGTDKGIVRWNGAEITSAGVPPSLRHTQVLAMIRDHDSNIWLGTSGGLIRVNADGVSVDGGAMLGYLKGRPIENATVYNGASFLQGKGVTLHWKPAPTQSTPHRGHNQHSPADMHFMPKSETNLAHAGHPSHSSNPAFNGERERQEKREQERRAGVPDSTTESARAMEAYWQSEIDKLIATGNTHSERGRIAQIAQQTPGSARQRHSAVKAEANRIRRDRELSR